MFPSSLIVEDDDAPNFLKLFPLIPKDIPELLN